MGIGVGIGVGVGVKSALVYAARVTLYGHVDDPLQVKGFFKYTAVSYTHLTLPTKA